MVTPLIKRVKNQHKKIKALQLVNIQSYVNEVFEFGEGINRILAGNDEGKSVIQKALNLVCGGLFTTHDELKSILRDHTTQGYIILKMWDDTIITAAIGDETCYMLTIDGVTVKYPLTPYPEEVNKAVGSLAFSDFCLNIRTMDEGLALVDTSDRLTNDILSAGFEDPRIDTYFNNIHQSLNDLADFQKEITWLRYEKSNQLGRLQTADKLIEVAKEEKRVSDLIEKSIKTNEMYGALSGLKNSFNIYKDLAKVYYPLTPTLGTKINNYFKITELCSSIQSLSDIKHTLRFETSRAFLSYMKTLKGVVEIFEEIKKGYVPVKKGVLSDIENTQKMMSTISYMKQSKEIIAKQQELKSLEFSVIKEVEKDLNTLKFVKDLDKVVTGIKYLRKTREQLEKELIEVPNPNKLKVLPLISKINKSQNEILTVNNDLEDTLDKKLNIDGVSSKLKILKEVRGLQNDIINLYKIEIERENWHKKHHTLLEELKAMGKNFEICSHCLGKGVVFIDGE